jgi:hypothetical protein
VPISIDVLHKLGIKAALVSIDNEHGNGSTLNTWEKLNRIKICENFNEDASSYSSTLRHDVSKTVHNFAIVSACGPSGVIFSVAKVQLKINLFSICSEDGSDSVINTSAPDGRHLSLQPLENDNAANCMSRCRRERE